MSGHYSNPLVVLAAALQQLQRASYTVHEFLEYRPCSLLACSEQAGIVLAQDGRL